MQRTLLVLAAVFLTASQAQAAELAQYHFGASDSYYPAVGIMPPFPDYMEFAVHVWGQDGASYGIVETWHEPITADDLDRVFALPTDQIERIGDAYRRGNAWAALQMSLPVPWNGFENTARTRIGEPGAAIFPFEPNS